MILEKGHALEHQLTGQFTVTIALAACLSGQSGNPGSIISQCRRWLKNESDPFAEIQYRQCSTWTVFKPMATNFSSACLHIYTYSGTEQDSEETAHMLSHP